MSSLFSHLGALGRAVALRPEARDFAARAWLGAPVVELSLAVAGLRRTLGWIEAFPVSAEPRHEAVSVKEGERLVRGAYKAHIFGGRCLSRSLVQYLLHRRDGTSARFVVGVRRPESTLDAHAWVEGASDPPANPEFQSILVAGPGGA